MTFSDKFDLDGPDSGPWTVRHAGTDKRAGTLTPDDGGFRLADAVDKDLGQFDSQEDALKALYGSD